MRLEIDRIDDEIIHLLFERLLVARQLGETKRTVGIPMYDPQREETVLNHWVEEARRLGEVDPGELMEVGKAVIALSKSVQK